MAASANAMSKYFVFTFNNYTDANVQSIQEFAEEYCTYMVFAREVGTSGTPHLQGYMELKVRKRVSSISRVLSGISLDKRRGTPAQARDYCLKGEQTHTEWELDGANGAHWGLNLDPDHYIYGEISSDYAGKRNDIVEVRDNIKSGVIKSKRDLLDTVKSLTSYKFGLEYLHCMDRPSVRSPPRVYWLHGSTGSGKSRAAHDFIEKVRATRGWSYWKSFNGLKWFDGYCGQEVAMFDDFRFDGNNNTFATLLRITDRYTVTLPVKGGVCHWYPKVIIFTAPRPAQDILASMREYRDGEDLGQFERRLSFTGDFDGEGKTEFNQLLDHYLVEQDALEAGPPDNGAQEAKGDDDDAMSIASTVAYSLAGMSDFDSDSE